MERTKVAAAELENPRQSIRRMISFSVLWLLLTSLTLLWGQNSSYHLIAGSFKTLKSANELVDVMNMKGYSPMIIFPNDKSSYYRVSIFSANDRSTVSSYKKQIGNSSKYWTLAVNGANLRTSTSSSTSAKKPQYTETGNMSGSSLYHVVVGSFPSRDAALRSQGARQSQGFDAYILDPEAGSDQYRLAVYRSNNRKEVEAYRQQLLRSGKVPSSWIHEQMSLTSTSRRVANAGGSVEGGVYHLIGASFQKFEDADFFKDQMRNEGFNSMILFPMPGVSTTYRVSLARSAVKGEVKEVKDRYNPKTKQKLWIYYEK